MEFHNASLLNNLVYFVSYIQLYCARCLTQPSIATTMARAAAVYKPESVGSILSAGENDLSLSLYGYDLFGLHVGAFTALALLH